MKKNRFKPGDLVESICGDCGLVLKVGIRKNSDEEKLGFYAHWVNENISFWMDMDEPSISLQGL